jgi:hypothetical protein
MGNITDEFYNLLKFTIYAKLPKLTLTIKIVY